MPRELILAVTVIGNLDLSQRLRYQIPLTKHFTFYAISVYADNSNVCSQFSTAEHCLAVEPKTVT